MHTPEQAKDLWCPMARIAREEYRADGTPESVVVSGCNTDALGGNRIPASCRCVADQCAMWRWATKPHAQDGIDRSHMQRHGYCGIAGRPYVA